MGLREKLFGSTRRTTMRRGAERTGETDAVYLATWARANTGVEAFVEPRTTVTPTTVVLVAADGRWTRRVIGGERGARKLGHDLRIPVYDVRKTGYPQRMRDHDARERILRRRAREAEA